MPYALQYALRSLTLVAALATTLLVRRATAVDPMTALRED